jgi:hypothetical protein
MRLWDEDFQHRSDYQKLLKDRDKQYRSTYIVRREITVKVVEENGDQYA